MIEKLKNQTIRAYQQLLDMDLGKFSRGVVSVISRETGTIVSTSAKGTIVTNLTDNSPSLKQHIATFCAFPTIAAIIQPYAKYATVFAQIGSDIPLLGSFHDDFFARDIPCISSVSNLHQTFCDRELDPHQTPALLLLHQGAFTWGNTLEDALENIEQHKGRKMKEIFSGLHYAKEKTLIPNHLGPWGYDSTKDMVRKCEDELVLRYGSVDSIDSYKYLLDEIHEIYSLIDNGLPQISHDLRDQFEKYMLQILFSKLEELADFCEETDRYFENYGTEDVCPEGATKVTIIFDEEEFCEYAK